MAYSKARRLADIMSTSAGIPTASIQDDAITSAKIADDAVTSALVADDAVVQALIADDAVDEARLQISSSGTTGHALTYQSGNTGKLTWAAMAGGVDGISSSADATAITIDSSERVLIPNQPGFHAKCNGSNFQCGNNQTWTDLIFDRTATVDGGCYNTGSHYDTSNGKFTAPIAGFYMVDACMRVDNYTGGASGYVYFKVKINTDTAFIALYQYIDQPDTANLHGTVKLDANDYVHCRTWASGDDTYNLDADSTFTMHFLG